MLGIQDVKNLLQCVRHHKNVLHSFNIAMLLIVLQALISTASSKLGSYTSVFLLLPAVVFHWMAAVEYRQALNNIRFSPLEDATTINPLHKQLIYFFIPLASFGLILELTNRINRQLREVNVDPATLDKIAALQTIVSEMERSASNTAN